MRRAKGFTLIELLVVIAIITILAGIVLPNVVGILAKARATRATAELNGIDIALTKMLTDTDKSSFAGFFDDPPDPLDLPMASLTTDQMKQAIAIYTDAFYILLKQGKSSDLGSVGGVALTLNPEVRSKLSPSYMDDLGKDPWGGLYQFFAGPWRGGDVPIPFVIRSVESDVPGGPVWAPKSGDWPTTEQVGVLFTDEDGNESELGWAPPKNRPIYVYSKGANLRSNQAFDDGYDGTGDLGDDFVGGGDDVNNWDKGNSWRSFYG